jgi:hypothetical protein
MHVPDRSLESTVLRAAAPLGAVRYRYDSLKFATMPQVLLLHYYSFSNPYYCVHKNQYSED